MMYEDEDNDKKLIHTLNNKLCSYCIKDEWVYRDHGWRSEHTSYKCKFGDERSSKNPCTIINQRICPLAERGEK